MTAQRVLRWKSPHALRPTTGLQSPHSPSGRSPLLKYSTDDSTDEPPRFSAVRHAGRRCRGSPPRPDLNARTKTQNAKSPTERPKIDWSTVDNAEDLGFDSGVRFEGDAGRFFVNRGKLTGADIEALKNEPLADDVSPVEHRQAPRTQLEMGSQIRADCRRRRHLLGREQRTGFEVV